LKHLKLKWFFDYINTKGKFFNFCIGLFCLAVVCVLDHLVSGDYSFSFFYLFPIGLTTWFAGRTAGIVIALLSAISWVDESQSLIIYARLWNMASTLGVFAAVCLLVDKVYKMWLKASEQSRIDYLTGLDNVRAFMENLEYAISRARRDGQPFSLGYIDLDNFKEVNDRYGHQKGDELLQCVGGCFKSGLRKTDKIARMGGDEFCIYFPDTSHEAVQVVMKKVRQRILDRLKEDRWPITFSMGVVTCTVPPRDVDEIILYADRLMYKAKKAGKNRIVYDVFTGSDDQ
jgi:diguanylate cyclase (GGDEF)-like protein